MKIVSLVMPVYNGEEFLQNAIESVLKQNYHNYELIIVDDGSTDSTNKIVQRFSDKRIKYFFQNNTGVSGARNLGIIKSIGDYICFIDSDDLLEPNYLDTLVELISDSDLGICNFSIDGKKQVTEIEGKKTKRDTFLGLFSVNSFRGFLFNKIFKKSIIQTHNISFDTDDYMCEDSHFCAKYCQFIHTSIYRDICLYKYMVRTNSASHSFNKKRVSVIYTYKKIINLCTSLEDATLTSIQMSNYYVHLIRLYKLSLKYKEEYKDLIAMLNKELRFNKKDALKNKYLKGKYKLYYLLMFR